MTRARTLSKIGSDPAIFPGNMNITGVATATTFSGAVTGNVTGDVTGDLTGDVTGDLTGDVTGDLTGDASGSSGSCTGNAAGLTGTPNISCGTIAGSTGTFSGPLVVGDTTATSTWIKATRSDSGNVWSGNSATAHTSEITKDGAAMFKSDLRVDHSNNAGSDKLLRLGNANNSGNNSAHLWTAGHYFVGPSAVDGTGYTAKIATATGDAEFKGDITATGATSYILAYQMSTGNTDVNDASATGTDCISNGQFSSKKASTDANGSICWRGVHGTSKTSLIYADGDMENANNSYGQYSDIKLKENIVDASSQWNNIKDIRVRNFNFIEGQTHTQIGVVAQEIETVSPGLVRESPDTDGDGNDLGTVTKSVKYSVLYMKAIKALQEAMTKIETLETKVAALEAA